LDIRGFGKVVFQESAKFGERKKISKKLKKIYFWFQPQRPKPEQPGPDQLPSLLL
jgi:hypothetical protein